MEEPYNLPEFVVGDRVKYNGAADMERYGIVTEVALPGFLYVYGMFASVEVARVRPADLVWVSPTVWGIPTQVRPPRFYGTAYIEGYLESMLWWRPTDFIWTDLGFWTWKKRWDGIGHHSALKGPHEMPRRLKRHLRERHEVLRLHLPKWLKD